MRVLYLPEWYPSESNPLSGVFTRELAELLGERYVIDAVVFGDSAITTPGQQIEKGFREVNVKVKGTLSGWIGWFNQVKALRKYLQKVQKSEKPYDLIHAQIAWKAGFTAMVLSRWFRIPYIVTEHYTGYMPVDGTLRGFRLLGSIYALNRANGISVVSNGLREAIQNSGVHMNIDVIPNAIHAAFLNTDVVQREPGSNTRFLHISNFDNRQKQTESIIAAFLDVQTRFPEISLTLVVPDEKWKQYLLKHPQIHPAFINVIPTPVNKEELKQIYSNSDALISYSLYETFGLTIAEAVSMGVPAIYTVCGGPEDYMTPEMGIAVNPNAIETLVETIEKITKKYHFDNVHISEIARHKFKRDLVTDAYKSLYLRAKE